MLARALTVSLVLAAGAAAGDDPPPATKPYKTAFGTGPA